MSRLTDESVRMPDRERFTADEPKRGRIINPGDLVKRFIMGAIGSCLFSAIMFFVQIKAFIAFLLAAILTFLGWTTEPPKEVKDAGKVVVGKLKDELKDHVPATSNVMPGGGLGLGHKSPEQLQFEADQKEAKRMREEESERRTLLARADVLKLVCDKDWPLEKLRVEVRQAELQAREAQDKAEEEERKKPLLARADKIGLQVDPTADYKTLKHQVEEAEKELAADADFQASHREWERAMEKYRWTLAHGNNAACPKCRNLMHINNPKGQGQCRRCLGIFPKSQMVAAFRPPPPPKEPKPPMKNPGLWTRLKGLMR